MRSSSRQSLHPIDLGVSLVGMRTHPLGAAARLLFVAIAVLVIIFLVPLPTWLVVALAGFGLVLIGATVADMTARRPVE